MKTIFSKKETAFFTLLISLFITLAFIPNFTFANDGEGANNGANPGLNNEAQIGNVYYPTLAGAIEAAKNGDTIKLISTDSDGSAKSIEIDTLWVDKKITLDMNDRDIVSYGYSFCTYEKTCDFKIINSGKERVNLGGIVYSYDNVSKITIGDRVEVSNYMRVNQNTVIDGSHLVMNISYDTALNNGKPFQFTFGSSYKVALKTNISFEDEELIKDLNDFDKPVSDILIAKNATQDIVNSSVLQDVNNQAVTLRLTEGGELYIHKELSSEFYLNGTSGNDDNDGKTIDTPVKSIDKIKKLVEDPKIASRKKTVFVTGTVTVNDIQKLELKHGLDVEFYRHKNFSGILFDVVKGGNLSISNVTIDGNKQKVSICNSPLIKIADGTVNIKNGAILQNNSYTSFGVRDIANGGAIQGLTKSKINISGGIIRWNKASMGGGIFAADASLKMTGGLITENELISASDEFFSTGGGISASHGSNVEISGGTISNNKASHGAGLSLGFYSVDSKYGRGKTTLNMTGGTFVNNVAERCGGGIFIQGGSKFANTPSVAYIKGGNFENNTAEKGMFSGGAIYVNGWHGNEEFVSGELHLENAVIKDNDSKDSGGGYASCPTAKTVNRVNNGVAIFDNKGNGGDDMSIHANVLYNGSMVSPPYELSVDALGGGLNKWIIDQQVDNGSNGKELRLNTYAGYLPLYTALSVKSGLNNEGKMEADKLAKVKITGNHAGGYGGGIASNGDVYFGKGDTINLTLHKTWDDEKGKDRRPEKIKVEIYRAVKGEKKSPEYIGSSEIYPDRNGDWNLTFKGLPRGNTKGDYIYTAKEIIDNSISNNYLQENSGGTSGKDGTIELKNTYEEVNVKVRKAWDDRENKYQKRPEEVVVRLLKNGEEIDSKVLSEKNAWETSFDNLPKYEDGKTALYTIKEDNVDGYKSIISKEGDYEFRIKNIYQNGKPDPKEPDSGNPDTSDTDNIMLNLSLISLFTLLFAILFIYLKNKNRDSKAQR